MASRRNRGHVCEKDGCTGIQPIRAEDAASSGDVQLSACERHTDRSQVLGACRGRGEVMVGPHTVSVADSAG